MEFDVQLRTARFLELLRATEFEGIFQNGIVLFTQTTRYGSTILISSG